MTVNGFGYNLLYTDFDIVACTDRVLQSLGFLPMTAKEKSIAVYIARGESALDVPIYCTNFAPLTELFIGRPVFECDVMNAFLVSSPFVARFSRLWTCNFRTGSTVFGFTQAQAMHPGMVGAPAVSLTLPLIGPTANSLPTSIALDGFGNLWVGYGEDTATGQIVAMFAASKLLVSATLTADIVIEMPTTGSDANAIIEMAFAPNGDLWVGTGINPQQTHEMIGFAAASLLVSGQPAPIARIKITPTAQVNGMRFDANGTLWVAQFNGTFVAGVTAAQLLATNLALVPAIKLTLGTGYANMVFDLLGQMWLTNFTANRVDILSASSLAASGSPAPVRSVGLGPGSPQQTQLDANGNLWVAEFSANQISGFNAGDFRVTGSIAPRSSLNGAGAVLAPIGLQLAP